MKEHKIVGKDYNNTKAFSYLAKVSNEKVEQSKEIIKEIKTLKNKDLLLDLGAGAGDIFKNTYKKFKKSIAVEPGLRMFDLLKKAYGKNTKVKLYNLKWEEFYKKYGKEYQSKFDMILLVHSIYFFKNPRKELKKLSKLLNPSGKIIVIIGGTKMKNKKSFIHHFRSKFLGPSSLKKENYTWIKKEFPNTKEKLFPTRIRLTNFDKLQEIHKKNPKSPTNYFLKFAFKRWFDEYTNEEIEQMKKFISENQEIDNKGNYILRGMQKMYVLKK